jgi:hypothetical protein
MVRSATGDDGVKVLALLETMWGSRVARAPRWFRINSQNFSGRRLYSLCGPDATLLVTNCCPIMQISAKHHGTPDPEYVADNLRRVTFDVLLVCGQVSARTYAASGYQPPDGVRVIHMMHPAARTWTRTELDRVARLIQAPSA